MRMETGGGGIVIPSGQGLVIGHTGSITIGGNVDEFQVLGASDLASCLTAVRYNSTSGATLRLGLSRHASIGTHSTAVQAGNKLGRISFYGSDTSTMSGIEMIVGYAGSTWVESTGGTPNRETYLTFGTAPADTLNPVERMRIESDGTILIGNNSSAQLAHIQTTSQSLSSQLKLSTAASATGSSMVLFYEGSGNGTPNNMGYWLELRGADDLFRFMTADGPGELPIWQNRTGTNDIAFGGGMLIGDTGVPPTGGLKITPGVIALGVTTEPSTLANYAHIYAKDLGNPTAYAEVYVRDESGNETRISPHNEQGEWEFYSHNTKTGKSFRVNMEQMIRKLEEITGENFIEK